MKKYQIATWNKESGFDKKLDFDTIKQAKENINLYTDYDYIYIIDTKTHQAIYSEHNKKQPKTEKTNRQKVLEFVIQDNMKTKDEVIDFCETNDIDYIFFENTQELFNYYDEEDYQSFSNGIIDVIFKNGNMLKILN